MWKSPERDFVSLAERDMVLVAAAAGSGGELCACILHRCLLGQAGPPRGSWEHLGRRGQPRPDALAGPCSESALVPRGPSPSAEASLPMASTTPSWPQWRSAPASPAACEWGLEEVLGGSGWATGSGGCWCPGDPHYHRHDEKGACAVGSVGVRVVEWLGQARGVGKGRG